MTSEFPADTALTAAGEKPHSSRKKSEKNFSVIPAASAPMMSDAMIRYGIIRCRVRSSSFGAPGEKEKESSQPVSAVVLGSGTEPKREGLAGLGRRLADEGLGLPQRYRALYGLRNHPDDPAAVAGMLGALGTESKLLKHELAFALGQMRARAAIPTLLRLLKDEAENSMVRHEAAEALGAISEAEALPVLRAHAADPCVEVAHTCQLALQRVEHYRTRAGGAAAAAEEEENPYRSVDPAPAAPKATPTAELRARLCDEGAPLFERYKALFGLRNQGGGAAVAALGAAFASGSALLKHEVAYVLGQMQSPEAIAVLAGVLRDQGEHEMVRHEAAEALGAIASPECVALLKAHQADASRPVAESCDIALDILGSEARGEFEYAATLEDALEDGAAAVVEVVT